MNAINTMHANLSSPRQQVCFHFNYGQQIELEMQENSKESKNHKLRQQALPNSIKVSYHDKSKTIISGNFIENDESSIQDKFFSNDTMELESNKTTKTKFSKYQNFMV